MKKHCVRAMIAVAAMATVRAGTSEAHATTVGDEVIVKINEYRQSLGLNTLAKSDRLQAGAERWTRHIVTTNDYTHEHTFVDYEGEILAAPNDDRDIPAQALKAWKESPDHNEIMTDPSFTTIGADCQDNPRDPFHYCTVRFR